MIKIGLAIALIVAAAVVAGVVCFILGGLHRRKVAEAEIGSASQEAERIINNAIAQAESKKKEAILEAKDAIHKERTATEQELRERRSEVQKQERRIMQREELLDKKSDIKGWIDKLTHTQIVNKHQVLGQMINSAMVTKLELMSFRSQLSTSEILAAYSAVYTDCKLDGTLVPSDKQATLLDLYKIIVKSICEGSDTFVVAEKIIILNHIMKEVICW